MARDDVRGSELQALAVAENRMITPREAKTRKVGALLTALATGGYVAQQGVKAASPIGVAFGTGMASTLLWTGVANQCGCAVRLRWVVDGPGKRADAPGEYKPFMRRKRRGVLINLVTSAAIGLAAGTAVGMAGGRSREDAAAVAARGAAIELGVAIAASYLA